MYIDVADSLIIGGLGMIMVGGKNGFSYYIGSLCHNAAIQIYRRRRNCYFSPGSFTLGVYCLEHICDFGA